MSKKLKQFKVTKIKNEVDNSTSRIPWSLVLYVATSVILLFTPFAVFSAKPTVQKELQNISPQLPEKTEAGIQTDEFGLPVRLRIPSIQLDAPVEHVGITASGAMDTPQNINHVGWFVLGSKPGEKGSAVISGHLDGKNGEIGVFTNLNKLLPGDELYVEDSKGLYTAFIVRESRLFDPGYQEDIFSQNDAAHLNLITCDGVWNGSKKSYTKRLVVFADKSQ